MAYTPKLIALEPLREVPAAIGCRKGEKWYRLKTAPDYAGSSLGNLARITVGRRGVQPHVMRPTVRFFRGTGTLNFQVYSNGRRWNLNLASIVHSIKMLGTKADETVVTKSATGWPEALYDTFTAVGFTAWNDPRSVTILGCEHGAAHRVKISKADNTVVCDRCGVLSKPAFHAWSKVAVPEPKDEPEVLDDDKTLAQVMAEARARAAAEFPDE